MRSLRPAVPDDAPVLAGFLRAEGVPEDGMAFRDAPTFVLEEGLTVMGFFTLSIVHDVFPQLVHLVIGREYRSVPRARFMHKALRAVVRAAGSPGLIVHACTAAHRRFLEYAFRAQPYAQDENAAYYVVAV